MESSAALTGAAKARTIALAMERRARRPRRRSTIGSPSSVPTPEEAVPERFGCSPFVQGMCRTVACVDKVCQAFGTW